GHPRADASDRSGILHKREYRRRNRPLPVRPASGAGRRSPGRAIPLQRVCQQLLDGDGLGATAAESPQSEFSWLLCKTADRLAVRRHCILQSAERVSGRRGSLVRDADNTSVVWIGKNNGLTKE